jgi:hypothetical protein
LSRDSLGNYSKSDNIEIRSILTFFIELKAWPNALGKPQQNQMIGEEEVLGRLLDNQTNIQGVLTDFEGIIISIRVPRVPLDEVIADHYLSSKETDCKKYLLLLLLALKPINNEDLYMLSKIPPAGVAVETGGADLSVLNLTSSQSTAPNNSLMTMNSNMCYGEGNISNNNYGSKRKLSPVDEVGVVDSNHKNEYSCRSFIDLKHNDRKEKLRSLLRWEAAQLGHLLPSYHSYESGESDDSDEIDESDEESSTSTTEAMTNYNSVSNRRSIEKVKNFLISY